ncbi:DUF3347 domain-containing protein [Flavobacterium hibernum]|uniref:Mercury transporter n=1 Tax=Flavobacterium hibernum TaxID=37752 RepID=A0A0D0ENQ6_9FLAO|nr:DUF3347 domain-containing protein [Flavobacterium hibernum]KIO54805.1 mercury transporter [Flavobacterium hibernum]OXA84777.1 mercury transporter [Flavobacterium hibernum]
MKSIQKGLMAITLSLSVIVFGAPIKNAKNINAKIYGNCLMCKTAIEKAGNIKNIASVNWNENTKIAAITYDEKKTNQDEVLKRIALAGYDSDQFLAPGDAYAKLPQCCQYERTNMAAPIKKSEMDMGKMDHSQHTAAVPADAQENSPFKAIFDSYFDVKDALVKTDAKTAALKSKELLTAINAIKMENLKPKEHTAWMNAMKSLASDATNISENQDVKKQRESFKSLSKNTYDLIKTADQPQPVYYNHCPMVDANWLSKESGIKNPYYGSQMLSCGSTIETIK